MKNIDFDYATVDQMNLYYIFKRVFFDKRESRFILKLMDDCLFSVKKYIINLKNNSVNSDRKKYIFTKNINK